MFLEIYEYFQPLFIAFFFFIVAVVYFLLPKVKQRVVWLLMASYFFYMYWNPIFILLILASTLIDFFASKKIDQTTVQRIKDRWMWLSVLVNLGILFYFKYYNFVRDNLQLVLDYFELNYHITEHHWMLPIGISFYTFQTISYTIDVYKGRQPAEEQFSFFALYVSFFPQLIAGPIERSTNLLPQFKEKHTFSYERVKNGLLLVLLGLFKKIVIADRFALYADEVFTNPDEYAGMTVVMGVVFFTFQIYCDFSGYTDIAIGYSKTLGFSLMDNFKGPYFSKSIKEFWRRWHISLSTWFRDYLYIPLGGNRGGKRKLYRNLIIVFLVTGLWHGANWTFVVWGIFHGIFLIVERLGWGKILERLPSVLQVAYSFIVVATGWIFFRADSLTTALTILNSIFIIDDNFWNINIYESPVDIFELRISLALLYLVIGLHYLEYYEKLSSKILDMPIMIRWSIYALLIYLIPLFGQYGTYKPFIYFQF